MNQRLFHVGLKIPETQLWDLMAVIEKLGGGDVEIRHIPEPESIPLDSVDTPKLVAPPPVLSHRAGNMKLVLDAMTPGTRVRPLHLAKPTGLTPKQVSMALYNLAKSGFVTRPEMGFYLRAA
jgi:hypothetical protein